MAIECFVCNKNIGRYDDYIACRGECNRNSHISCVNITVEKFTQMKEDGSVRMWSCKDCKCILTSIAATTMETEHNIIPLIKVLISDYVGKAVQDITKNIANIFSLEIEKLRSDNKKLSQEVNNLRNVIEKQISVQKVNTKSLDVPGMHISESASKDILQNTSINKTNKKKLLQNNVERTQPEESNGKNNISENQLKASIKNINKEKDINNDCNNTNYNEDEKEFIPVVRRKRRDNSIYGTASSSDSFAAVTRRAWLFIGRARQDVTAEQVNAFLQNKCPGSLFDVELLTKNDQATTRSFRVGMDFQLLEKLNKPEFWPCNIVVRRFNFFRPNTKPNPA